MGSALMLASQQGHVLQGMGMLLVYSLGLGVPFILSAVLIDSLRSALDWVKQHYKLINGDQRRTATDPDGYIDGYRHVRADACPAGLMA